MLVDSSTGNCADESEPETFPPAAARGGWNHDEATHQAAEKLLKQRYPSSPWTARLREPE